MSNLYALTLLSLGGVMSSFSAIVSLTVWVHGLCFFCTLAQVFSARWVGDGVLVCCAFVYSLQ